MTDLAHWKIEYTYNGVDKVLQMNNCPEPSKTRVRHKIKETEAEALDKSADAAVQEDVDEANIKIKIHAITKCWYSL